MVIPEASLLVCQVTDSRPSESLAVPEIVRLDAVVVEPLLGDTTVIEGTEPPELTTPGMPNPLELLRVTRTTREAECDELSVAVMVIMLAPAASGTAAVHAPEEASVACPDCPLLVCHTTAAVPELCKTEPLNVSLAFAVELPSMGDATDTESVGAGGACVVPPEMSDATAP